MPIVLIFLLALVLRLGISHLGFHFDLISAAGWGEWIFKHGTKGFYENRVWIYAWPSQPPLINLIYSFNYNIFDWIVWRISYVAAVISTHNIMPGFFAWWFNFVRFFGSTLYGETIFWWGFLISMKLPAILADLGLGIIIYFISMKNTTKPLLQAMAYLFLPFSWYLSALWGQYDQLALLLVLVSFLFLNKRYFFLSVLFLFFSGQAKPTTAYFLPLYIFYFFYQKPNIKNIILAAFGVIAAFWVMTDPFGGKDPFSYTTQVILPKVFFAERFEGLVNRSFNFWQMLEPFGGRSWFLYLGLPAYLWGYLSIGVFYVWSILVILGKNDLKNLIIGLYLIAGGSYLFGMGMLDRYFFPAVVFLIILTSFCPKLWKLCLFTILLFSFNLFYSWGYPFLLRDQAWQNSLVIRIGSFAQVATFLLCLGELQLFKLWNPVKRKI